MVSQICDTSNYLTHFNPLPGNWIIAEECCEGKIDKEIKRGILQVVHQLMVASTKTISYKKPLWKLSYKTIL